MQTAITWKIFNALHEEVTKRQCVFGTHGQVMRLRDAIAYTSVRGLVRVMG